MDASALQTDLEKVYQWAIDNNTMFNAKKFEALRYGTDDVLKATTSYISPDGSIIPGKDHLRDLGVTMIANGSFYRHISEMCQSARNMCGWILRTFQSRSPELMLTLWKSLVLPILDYCSQLWCPIKTGLIQEIDTTEDIHFLGLKRFSSIMDVSIMVFGQKFDKNTKFRQNWIKMLT